MTKMDKFAGFSRRSLLKTGGALVVSVGMAIGLDTVTAIDRAFAQGARPPLTPDQLSSYIAVNADGTISAFFGKIDGGQGVDVAIGQIVADELDVPFAKVKVVMGDSATSVNQGGASNASGIEEGAVPLRNAAAEARRVLVEMAAGLLSVPADKLVVNDGVVSAADDPSKRISYTQMIGGRYFNVPVEWNKKWGNPLSIVGKAKPKKPADGSSARRCGATTSRPKCLPNSPTSATSRCRAWCMGACCARRLPARCRRAWTKARCGTFPAPAWCGSRVSSASSPTRNGTRCARPSASK